MIIIIEPVVYEHIGRYLPGDAVAAAAAAAAEEDVGGDGDGGDRVAGPAAAGGGDSDPLDSAPLSDALELIPSVSWNQTEHVFTILFFFTILLYILYVFILPTRSIRRMMTSVSQ